MLLLGLVLFPAIHAPVVDRTEALNVADRFLMAWRTHDLKLGKDLASPQFEFGGRLESLGRFFEPRGTATYSAYEIFGGAKVKPSEFDFEIRLFEGYKQLRPTSLLASGLLTIRMAPSGKWSVKRFTYGGTKMSRLPTLDALRVANQSLEAWIQRDRKVGAALLTPALIRHMGGTGDDTNLSGYLVGLSNPHHEAFEITSEVGVGRKRVGYEVRLYEAVTGDKNPPQDRPKPGKMILSMSPNRNWLIDTLP